MASCKGCLVYNTSFRRLRRNFEDIRPSKPTAVATKVLCRVERTRVDAERKSRKKCQRCCHVAKSVLICCIAFSEGFPSPTYTPSSASMRSTTFQSCIYARLIPRQRVGFGIAFALFYESISYWMKKAVQTIEGTSSTWVANPGRASLADAATV